MPDSVLVDSIQSTDSNITVKLLNVSKSPPTPDFYVWDDNRMELRIENNSDSSISFNYVELTTENLEDIPILIQVDNVLSQEEIEAMQLDDSDWELEVLSVDNPDSSTSMFWALTPPSDSNEIGAGETFTIIFDYLSIKDKPLRNGLVQIQINCTEGKLDFQEEVSLIDTSPKSLQDDLSIEFIGSEGMDLANTVRSTPINKGEPIKNNLCLQFKNLNSTSLVENELANEGRFFISFVASDYPEKTPNALATVAEISAFDVSINPSDGVLDWGIKEISQSHVPYWELIPYKNSVLDAGESFEFNISNIITHAPVGTTKMYVSYRDIPSYADGTVELPIQVYQKEEYIASFLADSKSSLVLKNGRIPVKITCSVFSTKAQDWTITTKEGAFIGSFTSKEGEPTHYSVNHQFKSMGKYELILQPSESSICKTIWITIKEQMEYRSVFYLASDDGIQEYTIDIERDTFSLKTIVEDSAQSIRKKGDNIIYYSSNSDNINLWKGGELNTVVPSNYHDEDDSSSVVSFDMCPGNVKTYSTPLDSRIAPNISTHFGMLSIYFFVPCRYYTCCKRIFLETNISSDWKSEFSPQLYLSYSNETSTQFEYLLLQTADSIYRYTPTYDSWIESLGNEFNLIIGENMTSNIVLSSRYAYFIMNGNQLARIDFTVSNPYAHTLKILAEIEPTEHTVLAIDYDYDSSSGGFGLCWLHNDGTSNSKFVVYSTANNRIELSFNKDLKIQKPNGFVISKS